MGEHAKQFQELSSNRLLMPTGRDDPLIPVQQLAIREAGKLKKVLSHVRYMCRSGVSNARHPVVRRLKSFYQSKGDHTESLLELAQECIMSITAQHQKV